MWPLLIILCGSAFVVAVAILMAESDVNDGVAMITIWALSIAVAVAFNISARIYFGV